MRQRPVPEEPGSRGKTHGQNHYYLKDIISILRDNRRQTGRPRGEPRLLAPRLESDQHVEWNYRDFYMPGRVSARAEATDGSSWMEIFPVEFFAWLDRAHDRPQGMGLGGVHHPNITLPEAMARYVIVRNRSKMKPAHSWIPPGQQHAQGIS